MTKNTVLGVFESWLDHLLATGLQASYENLSEPQFSNPQNGHNKNSTCLLGLVWRLNELLFVNHLEHCLEGLFQCLLHAKQSILFPLFLKWRNVSQLTQLTLKSHLVPNTRRTGFPSSVRYLHFSDSKPHIVPFASLDGKRKYDFSPFVLNLFADQHPQIIPVLSQRPWTQWPSSSPVGPQASPRWQNTAMGLPCDPLSLQGRKEVIDLWAGLQIWGGVCMCVHACVGWEKSSKQNWPYYASPFCALWFRLMKIWEVNIENPNYLLTEASDDKGGTRPEHFDRRCVGEPVCLCQLTQGLVGKYRMNSQCHLNNRSFLLPIYGQMKLEITQLWAVRKNNTWDQATSWPCPWSRTVIEAEAVALG